MQFRLGRYRKATATPIANTVELPMAANATFSAVERHAAGEEMDRDAADAQEDRKRKSHASARGESMVVEVMKKGWSSPVEEDMPCEWDADRLSVSAIALRLGGDSGAMASVVPSMKGC